MKMLFIIVASVLFAGMLTSVYQSGYDSGYRDGLEPDITSHRYQDYMKNVYVPRSQNMTPIDLTGISVEHITIEGNHFDNLTMSMKDFYK